MRNVLVIEDQQDIAHLVRLHLQDLPCKVELAFDGASGLAAAEKKPSTSSSSTSCCPASTGSKSAGRLRARARRTRRS